jgi:hypothetical protein
MRSEQRSLHDGGGPRWPFWLVGLAETLQATVKSSEVCSPLP